MKTALLPKSEPRIDEAIAGLLTGRQRQILNLILIGHSNREIALILQISVRTVEVHRFNLMRKLNVRNVAQLLQRSLHLRLLSASVIRSRPGNRGLATVLPLPVEGEVRKAVTSPASNPKKKAKLTQVCDASESNSKPR
jgi:DNA-binding CsgD family transcriptional regulator